MYDCTRLVKAIHTYLIKADDDLKQALEDAGFADPTETVKEIDTLESGVTHALQQQTDYVNQKMRQSVDLETFEKKYWNKVKQQDQTGQTLERVFLTDFKANMPKLISSYSVKIDSALVVSQMTKRTTAWMKLWSKELAHMMNLTSHNEIEGILQTGLSEGSSIAQITHKLRDSDIRNPYVRARRVALTEVLRTHSYAQQEAMMQNPAAVLKEWAHTGAHRNEPRVNHVALNGAIVGKEQPFKLLGQDGMAYAPMFPRDTTLPPGESVNCHCIHRAIVSEEILGLPLEERKRLQEQAIAQDDRKWEQELDARNRARAGIEQV